MEIYQSAMWFLAGVGSHLVISKLLGMYHGIALFQEMEKFTSLCASALVKDTRALLHQRAQKLKKLGKLDAGEQKQLEEVDALVVAMFERSLLIKMVQNCPSHYRQYLKYTNWQELEDYAGEQERIQKQRTTKGKGG